MANNNNNVNISLKVCHWNANGLECKFDELKDFILENEIDIMLVNETKFNNRINCCMTGYTCFRKDRNARTTGGGVLILVKNEIKCKEITLNPSKFETVGVELSSGLIIISAYVTPKTTIEANELASLFTLGNKVFVMGDFNAKHTDWNCQQTNKNGRALQQYVSNQPIVVLAPDSYTCYPYTGALPSIIDLALLKNINNCTNIETLNESIPTTYLYCSSSLAKP